MICAQRNVFGIQVVFRRARYPGLRPVSFPGPAPGPRVAEPQRRQQVQRGGVRSAVDGRDPDQNVVGLRLGVLRENIKVSIVLKYAGIQQFELRIAPAATRVLFDKPRIRKFRLRVFVQRLHVGVRRSGVHIEITLLHVLAMIGLGTADAKQPLLQYWIAAVPQGYGEAQTSFAVANTEQAVFAPAVRAATRMVVGKIGPARTVGRIVFAYRTPLPLGKIWPPTFPVLLAASVFRKALALGACRGVHQRFPSNAITFLIPGVSRIASRKRFSGSRRVM